MATPLSATAQAPATLDHGWELRGGVYAPLAAIVDDGAEKVAIAPGGSIGLGFVTRPVLASTRLRLGLDAVVGTGIRAEATASCTIACDTFRMTDGVILISSVNALIPIASAYGSKMVFAAGAGGKLYRLPTQDCLAASGNPCVAAGRYSGSTFDPAVTLGLRFQGIGTFSRALVGIDDLISRFEANGRGGTQHDLAFWIGYAF